MYLHMVLHRVLISIHTSVDIRLDQIEVRTNEYLHTGINHNNVLMLVFIYIYTHSYLHTYIYIFRYKSVPKYICTMER